MTHKFSSLEWIPWQRYVLRLHISDHNKTLFWGRFRLAKSAQKESNRLSNYQGYNPEIIDTKILEAQQAALRAAQEEAPVAGALED